MQLSPGQLTAILDQALTAPKDLNALDALETQLSAQTKSRHVTVVDRYRSAFSIAATALRLKRGTRVLVPAICPKRVVSAMLAAGWEPHFVDTDADTGLLSPKSLTGIRAHQAQAVVACNPFGRRADIEALRRHGDAHGWLLIEDCGEASGFEASTTGAHVTLGTLRELSHDAVAAIFARNNDVASMVREHARAKGVASLQEPCTPTELTVALETAYFPRFPSIRHRRRMVADWYRQGLARFAGAGIQLPADTPSHQWPCYAILLPERDAAQKWLVENGVAAVRPPPAWHLDRRLKGFFPKPTPNSDKLLERLLALPFSASTTTQDLHRIVNWVARWCERC